MNRAEHNANQCRIDYRITELPLRLSTVTGLVQQMGGEVKTYLQAEEEIKRRNIKSIMEAKPNGGFSVINKKGRFTIYIADSLDENRKIFIIAHEIGHYCCGHLAVLPLGMSDSLDDAQEIEANDFARTFMAPPYFLYRTKCSSIEKIQQRTLLDLDNALRVLALVHSDNNKHPTRQERQLYDMMMGIRKLVPIAVGSGVAAFFITAAILLSVVWKPSKYQPAFGPASSVPSDTASLWDAPSVSSAPSTAQSSMPAAADQPAVSSAPAPASKPEQAAISQPSLSSVPALTDSQRTKAEITAIYQAKGQILQAKISEADTKITDAATTLEAAEADKRRLEWAYEQLVITGTIADHVLADIETLIAAKKKEIAALSAELKELETEKAGLIEELSALADQYMKELTNTE